MTRALPFRVHPRKPGGTELVFNARANALAAPVGLAPWPMEMELITELAVAFCPMAIELVPLAVAPGPTAVELPAEAVAKYPKAADELPLAADELPKACALAAEALDPG